MLFCRLVIFQNQLLKISFRKIIRVSNCLGPDQSKHSDGPGLGPNCLLQRLSADDTRRQRVHVENMIILLLNTKSIIVVVWLSMET